MAAYSHMRYNVAKDIAYDPFQAAQHVRIPMLIIDAGSEELMDIKQNGGRVAGILKANGTPVSYHVIPGIGHYGVYGEKFSEALKMELDWFDKHLKPADLAQPKSDPSAEERSRRRGRPETGIGDRSGTLSRPRLTIRTPAARGCRTRRRRCCRAGGGSGR